MNYSKINHCDIANGVGVRVSLFVSGCERHCKGCFNESTWPFDAGQPFTKQTLKKILTLCEPYYVNGLTLLGGEPLHPRNLGVVTEIAQTFKKMYPDKNLWCYTGYTYDEVRDLPIMQYIDVLVDGAFIEEQKDISISFRGSRNQKIIQLHKVDENELR